TGNWFQELEQIFGNFPQGDLSDGELLKNLSKSSSWIYLVTTPGSILLLLEEGIATSEKLSQLSKILRIPSAFIEHAKKYEKLLQKDPASAKSYLEELKKEYFI